jgi:hypothetical protein
MSISGVSKTSPPIFGIPPSRFCSANVPVDAPPTSLALQTITELF